MALKASNRRQMNWITLVMLSAMLLSMRAGSSFREEQMKYPRVRNAFAEKASTVKRVLRASGVDPDSYDIYIRGFKQEGVLEVWARNRGGGKYLRVAAYPFCATAGTVGPKRRQGDNQIPEGLYELSGFNPNSNYLLSLKVSYPNEADRRREGDFNLGGQIFIHGGCQTIGCIPITDDRIKELYIMAVQAKNSGQQKIRIDIFPNRLSLQQYDKLRRLARTGELVRFWGNLRTCITYFQRYRKPPDFSVDASGHYIYLTAADQ